MAQKKNPVLRLLVPLLVLIAGIGVAAAVFTNTGSRRGQGGPPAPQTQPAAAPAPGEQPAATSQAAAPAPGGAQPTAPPAPVVPAPAEPIPQGLLTGLKAEVVADPAPFDPIGQLESTELPGLLEFSPIGAGVRRFTLAAQHTSIQRTQHQVVQEEHDGRGAGLGVVTPLAAVRLEINDAFVDLSGLLDGGADGRSVWRQTAPGSFEAVIVNQEGTRIGRVTRRYELTPRSHVIRLHQAFENLTDRALTIRWWQFGPVSLEQDSASYGGDKRRLRFGYLARPQADPTRQFVQHSAFDTALPHSTALGDRDEAGRYPASRVQWPNERTRKSELSLVWTALTNRYFGAAVFPLLEGAGGAPDKVLHLAETVYSVVLNPGSPDAERATVALQTRSEPMAAPAAGAVDLSAGAYFGPLSRREIRRDPAAEAAGLEGLVVYNFGGPCGWCTFPILTGGLLSLLLFLHDTILHDWALAIIVLVVIVRTILHPVTKWSQVRMARFGKQMQELAPKQKKLQERFKDDPKKMREEMGRLWREEGVSPTGALGCIPMFLQSPIWIALYAMLYFAVELRHEPAFFGVFQAVVPNHFPVLGWFMGDLSEPDRFWYFGRPLVTLPLLGPIDSLNLLPLLLGVVFYIQQKYLTPPTTTPLTPEQEQTQKMMKVMMVVMFPLFMYNAPSGLAVYFICNSTLGILESKYIRSHIDKYDLLKPRQKTARPGGFMARLQALAEERKRQLDRMRTQQGKQGRRAR